MPDITMCSNGECEKKFDCYRYMCKPSYMQSYSNHENSCEAVSRGRFVEIIDISKMEKEKLDMMNESAK